MMLNYMTKMPEADRCLLPFSIMLAYVMHIDGHIFLLIMTYLSHKEPTMSLQHINRRLQDLNPQTKEVMVVSALLVLSLLYLS